MDESFLFFPKRQMPFSGSCSAASSDEMDEFASRQAACKLIHLVFLLGQRRFGKPLKSEE